jgi:hypothetical protein
VAAIVGRGTVTQTLALSIAFPARDATCGPVSPVTPVSVNYAHKTGFKVNIIINVSKIQYTNII